MTKQEQAARPGAELWRCRVFGHAGDWSRSRTDAVHWFSHCTRCGEPVVRDCSGGGWRPAKGGSKARAEG